MHTSTTPHIRFIAETLFFNTKKTSFQEDTSFLDCAEKQDSSSFLSKVGQASAMEDNYEHRLNQKLNSKEYPEQILRDLDKMNEGDYSKCYEKIQQLTEKEEFVQNENQEQSQNWVCVKCKNEMFCNCIQVEPVGSMPCITFALPCWPCKLITPLSCYKNDYLPEDQFITPKQVTGGYQMNAKSENEAIEEFENNEQACLTNSKITNTSEPKPGVEIYDSHPNQYCCNCNNKLHIWCLKEKLPEIRSIVLAVCWTCESITPLACFFENHSSNKVTNPVI